MTKIEVPYSTSVVHLYGTESRDGLIEVSLSLSLFISLCLSPRGISAIGKCFGYSSSFLSRRPLVIFCVLASKDLVVSMVGRGYRTVRKDVWNQFLCRKMI